MHVMGNYPLAVVLGRDSSDGSEDAADVDPWPTTSLHALVDSETFNKRLEFFVRNSNRFDVSPKMIRSSLELQFGFSPFFGMPVKSKKRK